MMLKKLTAGVLSGVLALSLAACSGSSGNTATSSASSTLRLGNVLAPPTQMAAEASWANASPYYQAVYDTLLRETPDGEIIPWLATSYEYDDARTQLTLKLRTDVKFSDGTAFDADVAAQNIMRYHEGASPNAGDLAAVDSAVAVDASTLRVTLTEPDPGLLLALTQGGGLQESPKHFGASDEKTNPVGSGPYVLDTAATVIGSKYVYTKNTAYWAPQDQHYEKVEINVYTDQQTAVNAIKGKQIDFFNLLNSTANQTIEASGYSVKSFTGSSWIGLVLADRSGAVIPELQNVKVRQAINYAINRAAIVKAVDGTGDPTTQIFGSITKAYDKSLDSKYPYDPAKAKQLLAEAGYAEGFSFTSPQYPVGIDAAYDLLKQDLAAVGITVNYETANVQNFPTDIGAGKWGAFMFILGAGNTWTGVKDQILSPVFNPFKTTDATLEGFINTIKSGSDSDAEQAGKNLNAYIVDQAWYAPFYQRPAFAAVAANTTVELQPDNAYPYLWTFQAAS